MLTFECPGCGTVVSLAAVETSADEFCRVCDYPLFWAEQAQVQLVAAEGADAALAAARLRRPGAAGRQTPVGEPCPSCGEINVADATYCHRCGSPMRPEPVPVAAPEVVVEAPEPPPPPPVPWWRRHLVPLVAGVATLVGLVVLVLLLVV
jgi:hypothetical protein